LNQLGLFAKFWQPGTVKTRLAADIGEQTACELYRAFVFHLVERLCDSADERSIVFSPSEREQDFRKSVPTNWKLCPQSSGDLGTRMHSFFRDQFESELLLDRNDSSPHKIVIIGADCPQLDPCLVQSAFDRLDKAPVVIGPSNDGGYYLIAMRGRCIDVFADIEWSTETVFERTARRLRELNVEFQTLPALTDVDDLTSLLALKSELENREFQEPLAAKPVTQVLDSLDRRLLNKIQLATARTTLGSD
jgi:rSAM/selenodomain-associated transferase 1